MVVLDVRLGLQESEAVTCTMCSLLILQGLCSALLWWIKPLAVTARRYVKLCTGASLNGLCMSREPDGTAGSSAKNDGKDRLSLEKTCWKLEWPYFW